MKKTLLNLMKTKMAKASILIFIILMLSLSTALAQFTWTTSQTGFDQSWFGITYGNGVFVAVGQNGTGNRVMTSPDGIAWTSRTSAANNTWNSVTYGNNLFVAVASSGTGNRVMTSPDGITWTSRTSAANNSWNSVTYGNGLFVAVAYSGTGNRVMTSPDGISWTIGVSPADNPWRSVIYGNGLFVAVASYGTPSNRVMTSPDGINWTIRTSAADNAWRSVTYGNGLFVAVANSGAGNRVMTSPDGITWTMIASAAENEWWSVTYSNNLFVAVANTGDGNRVMTSPDGIAWTIRASAANNKWNSVTYGNGLFVAVANSGAGNRVMTSPDGTTWTSVTYVPDLSWQSVTYGNGLYVAVAVGFSGTGNRVMTSPDGIAWTSRSSAADNNWYSVSYGNGLFVAVSNNGAGNRVMTSPDGFTWTSRSPAADNMWRSVTCGNGLFVAVSTDGSGNRVMTSPDGINWTSRSSAADNNWFSVTYGNGLFVAVAITGTGDRVMTSPDGITWTIRPSAADVSWTSVTYGNGLFVAVAEEGSVMTSPDGFTWTSRTPAANNPWYSVIYGNGLFVAVAGGGIGNRVMTSPDGITWTIRSSAADVDWNSVTYGNGLFVAVGMFGVCNNVMKSVSPVPILPPTAQPTNLYFSTTKTGGNNNIVLHYTASASAEKYLIVRKTGSAPTFVPSDGTEYTVGVQVDDQVVYVGTAVTATDATVTSDIAYHYKIYAYNGSAATTKYLTTSPLSGNTSVYSTPATLPVTSATVSAGFPNAGVTVTFPSGTTGTTLTVTQTALAPVANFSALPGVRGVKNLYFTITSTNPAPGTFILIVDFSSLGLTEAQWNNFKVLKRANAASAWVDVTTLGATITSRQTDGVWGKFTISGLSSFSDFAGGEAATTVTVVSAAETGAGTLKQLITDATAGDIITFDIAPGNTITLSSPVVIDKDLTIRGAAGGIILNGNNATRVMTVNDAVTARLENLKIQNGNDPAFYVGGIKNEGKLTMINCVVSENIATGSLAVGGVLSFDAFPLDGDVLNLVNSTITGNTGESADGAGGLYSEDEVNIYNTIISGNTGFYSDVDETINEIAESYNSLFGNDVSSKITAGTGNLFSQNPLFVGIVANPTHPYAIGAASPCADAGADSYSFETTDIRGGTFGRKLNKTTGATGTIDMGAYEFNPGLTWDGSESNDWNTAGNWSSNTVPFSTDDVLIPNTVSNYPTLGAAGACNNITMQSGASLLGNAYLTVSGTAAVDRAIPGASQAWHFLSSPVAAQAISPAFTADPATSYDIFAWYEPTGEWVNFKNTTIAPTWNTANVSTNFTTCKGYLVEYTGTGLTKQFTGNLNSGNKTFTLSKAGSGTYAAYNLAGNPYPSAIDWKAASGWTRTALVSSGGGYDMSIWNDVDGQYGSFNSAGASGTHGATQYIAVGQGFMVKAALLKSGNFQGSPPIYFGMTDVVRVHNTQAYLKSTDAIANILRIKVAGDANTYSDEIVVEFGHPTANGGAEKMFSFYETAPSLYTVKPDGKYSVDFRGEPGAVTIPLSFKAGADGSYTLTTSQLESFTSSTDITLEDLKLNTTQSLMQNPVYTFSSTKTDDGARFLLHFGGTFNIGKNAKGKPTKVYASENTVCISNTSGGVMNGDVYVYNTIGQLIMQQKLGGETQAKITLNVTTGCYLVKVVTSENTCST